MDRRRETEQLELETVNEKPIHDGMIEVRLNTNHGMIPCRLHPVKGGNLAVVWVGGAGGGLDGPAGGMYPRLAKQLVGDGIASLRLSYRKPNFLTDCVLDTLLGIHFMEGHDYSQLVLVGHSFGGAVVISAGAMSGAVVGVATLSTQNAGTNLVEEMEGRCLLLIHGQADTVLDDFASREVYQRAHQPKRILLYPNCGHGLDECRQQVDHDLSEWIKQALLKEA